MATYGGDEVSTIVLDVGSHTVRGGYAGEEAPRAYFPSDVGRVVASDTDGDTDMSATGEGKPLAGDLPSSTWRPNLRISSIFNEKSLVEDWDGLEAIWSYALKDRLGLDPQEYPLFLTEPAWASKEQRAKMAELAFEQFNVPAFFLSKSPVLNAFAGGKSSALVIDIGASQSSVAPVVDGYVLRKALQHQALGGAHLSEAILSSLTAAGAPTVIHPPYRLLSKRPVAPNRPAEVTLRDRPGTHPSFEHTACLRVIDEYKESVCQVSEIPWDEPLIAARASKPYEFPDGFNVAAGPERFRIPELLFDPSPLNASSSSSKDPLRSIPDMVYAAVSACDTEVRGHLLNNIILTGGTTALPGFADRLLYEMNALIPGARVKIVYGNTQGGGGANAERRFSSWLGGSILGSLGTFQQLWVGKAEWEEGGASVLEKKCQ